MAKNYWVTFTTGLPSTISGLTPTFVQFCKFDGTTLASPSISEPVTGSGLYMFSYTPSFSIAFTIDGFTTSLAAASRYIKGSLDPIDQIDSLLTQQGSTLLQINTNLTAQGSSLLAIGSTLSKVDLDVLAVGTTLVAQGSTIVGMGNTLGAMGNTLLAIGTSLTVIVSGLGSTASLIGDNVTNPVDLFGYIKRVSNFLEGVQIFTKTSGIWQIYDRTGATLLDNKTITESSTQVNRT